MKYISTRAGAQAVSAAEAIKKGIAEDGGLYMPQQIPTISTEEITSLIPLPYPVRAAKILSKFLTDYTLDELLEDTEAAYSKEKFPIGATPIVSLNDMSVLELFHGPTCAFKDMALQLMPRLFVRALRKCGEQREALILVATSGDTGGAALCGYADVPGTKIQVFFPTDGVSKIQRLQMQTARGKNVSVHAIQGNFDDAQSGVKAIFGDHAFASTLDSMGVFLSSANSINWGRLVPQIVYYVSAYCDLVKNGSISLGDTIDITVPTGNFGNIFAAYIAKRAGVPIGTLICASNANNVLTDFLTNGVYDKNRPFYKTISPSMDILISSNLERLLFLTLGAEKTRDYMNSLTKTGRYQLSPSDFAKIRSDFVGCYADEETTRQTLSELFQKERYLADTHTSVAVFAAREYMRNHKVSRKMLTVSTASAFKFASDVLASLGKAPENEDIRVLYELSALTGETVPEPLSQLSDAYLRFDKVIGKEQMKACVTELAKKG